MNLVKATYFDEKGVERSLKNSRPVGVGSAKVKTVWPFRQMHVGCEMSLPGKFSIGSTNYEENAPVYALRWLKFKFKFDFNIVVIPNGLHVKRIL